jgi:hypothetical protein
MYAQGAPENSLLDDLSVEHSMDSLPGEIDSIVAEENQECRRVT